MLKVVGTEAAQDEGDGHSLLDEIACEGARRMLVAALETEVAAYLEAHRDERDAEGHALVVVIARYGFWSGSAPLNTGRPSGARPLLAGPLWPLRDLDRQQLIAWTAEEHLGMPRDLSTGDVDAVSMSTSAARSLWANSASSATTRLRSEP